MFRVIFVCLCFSGNIFSETDDLPKSARIWHGTLGLNFNWIGNKNYVNLNDLTSITPGITASWDYKLIENPHEWRNHAEFSLQYNYYPPPSVFIKQDDSLRYETIYLYHWLDWFGFFGGLSMKTSVAPGEDFESGNTTYKIIDAVTQDEIEIIKATHLDLTDPFAPFILEEQLGLFVQPLRKKELFMEFRLGTFGREIFAKGQRVLIPSSGADTLVRELSNIYELGPAFGSQFEARFFKDKLSYRLTFDMAWALLQEPMIKPNNFSDRFSFDLNSALAFKLISWLSVKWNLKVLQNPALIDKVQILSNLTLAANFSF